MNISIFKKEKTAVEQISAAEAHNIYSALKSRYGSIETFQIFDNFVHDRELSIILNDRINEYHKQEQNLENLCKKHLIKLPSRPPKKMVIEKPSDELSDKLIYRHIERDIVYELLIETKSIAESTINDEVRKVFVDFSYEHLTFFSILFRYGKLKGWAEITPSFVSEKKTGKELLAVGEASHLWDHISLRYDQIQLTEIMLDFVHDPEFKNILLLGNMELDRQAKILERKAIQFGVPLPERAPSSQKSTVDPETIEDKFIFRVIFKGIQEAIDMHARAVIETSRNDAIRKFFFNLYKREVSIFNKFLQYGKLKGWVHAQPIYKRD